MANTRKLLTIVASLAGAVAGAGALAGWLLSAPRYKGPKSDHFDGRRFHNLEPTEHAGMTDMVKWMATRDEGPWDEWRDIPPAPKPPERVANGIRITFINHASLLIQTANVNILTDPIWSERCSPFPFAGPKRHHPPGVRFEDLPPIDAVLLSHNHYDHMDIPSLQRLGAIHQPRVLSGLGNDVFLRTQKIARTTSLDWWGSDAVGAVRIHVVPAQHFSSRGLADRDANLWCGYVLETPSGAIYFAGDTGWGSHFETIRERFAPIRVAMLPIGAFRPVWFMRAVHISPGEAVRASRALGAEVSIPMHYGTFHLGDDGQDEPVEVLRREGGEAFRVLKPGESVELRDVP